MSVLLPRTKKASVCLTEDELAALRCRAAAAGRSISGHLRWCALARNLIILELDGLSELCAQLQRCSSLLSGLQENGKGPADPGFYRDLQVLKDQQSELLKTLTDVLAALR